MMDSSLIDPHNHAPKVAPDDVWGDAEVLHPNFNASATVLPPKRARNENSPFAPAVRNSGGLRIDSNPQRTETDDTEFQQLEVQHLDCSVVRLNPEAPMVAKVPRHVAFHERPTQIEDDLMRRGEGKEWGRSRKQSFRWVLGTGMGVAMLVVVSIMLLPLINKSNAARQDQAGPAMVPEADVKGAEALNNMLTRQPEAERIFRKFATAMVVDDILPLIRDSKTVEALVRAGFRPGGVSKAWIPSDDTQWGVFEANHVQYGILEGTLPDFTKFSAYLVFSENLLQLDWKASTCYGSATFDELKTNRGNPSEIRAMIATTGFYTDVFPESEFQSYQLISQNKQDSIWCYARRGEAAAGKLSRLLEGGEILTASTEPQKVTVRLERGPEGSLPNQWLIAEMLHKDWLTP